MPRNVILGVVLVVVSLGLFCVAVSIPLANPAPPVVGSDGTTVGGGVDGVMQLIMLIVTALGGGSLATAITAFWGKWGAVIQKAIPVPIPSVVTPPPIPVPAPVVPVSDPVADFEEFVAAAIAYSKNKTDPALLRRFVMAANIEIYDAISVKSPKLAAALNALLVEAINEFAPAAPVAV